MSKVDTPMTAAAMAPRTRPPATTERRVFLREGVTAASATRGLASAAAVPTVTAAESFSTLELLGAGAERGERGRRRRQKNIPRVANVLPTGRVAWRIGAR